jgi:tripartite-type tricarboxylate transporter receptor subunit TctC
MSTRRTFLTGSLIALAAGLAGAPALADTWPEQPVRIIVSFPPGGSSDLVARLLSERLSESLGQQFVVENMPGAAGTVAAGALAEAAPDGYTFMLSNLTPFNVAPIRFPDTPYDPIEDFDHITYVGTVHMGLFVAPAVGADTLADFVAAAQAAPGEYEYGSSGVGSWGHIVAETFADLSETELFHIPYRGSGPMRLDFRAGVVPAIFDAVPQNLPAVADGTAIPLAVTAPTRIASLPDVPTFTELGHDLVAENWLGVSGPAGVPEEIRTALDAALQAAMADPEVVAQFDGWGLVRAAMTSAEFEAYVAAQFEQWATMVPAAVN